MSTSLGLTVNQEQFVKLAKKSGLEVDYHYSGRNMYGRTCPAVRVRDLSEWQGNPHIYNTDQMGKGYVIYCQD